MPLFLYKYYCTQQKSRTMVNPHRFYTYAYLRQDRTPYYIGKGQGNRVYYKCKGVKPPKDKSRIIFLKQNLTEEEAFKHEKYMVFVFGRKDLGTGILHNRTDGGDGTSGIMISEETRRKMSEVQKGKLRSEKDRRKISEKLKGRTLSEEHRRKMSVAHTGKSFSEEHKRKMSEVQKGRTFSEEHRKKISEAKKGKRWWNDGCGNRKFEVECPGENWVLGKSVKNERSSI